MVDKNRDGLSLDNVCTLFFYLGVEIDARIAELRKQTPFEGVRPADARILVIASRRVSTLSEIARTARVTRQSVHLSAQRLHQAGLLVLESRDGDKREKTVVLTDLAWDGIQQAEKHVRTVEGEFAEGIGKEGLELLRGYLKSSLQQLRDRKQIK